MSKYTKYLVYNIVTQNLPSSFFEYDDLLMHLNL